VPDGGCLLIFGGIGIVCNQQVKGLSLGDLFCVPFRSSTDRACCVQPALHPPWQPCRCQVGRGGFRWPNHQIMKPPEPNMIRL
jgi:hypothetical protein